MHTWPGVLLGAFGDLGAEGRWNLDPNLRRAREMVPSTGPASCLPAQWGTQEERAHWQCDLPAHAARPWLAVVGAAGAGADTRRRVESL